MANDMVVRDQFLGMNLEVVAQHLYKSSYFKDLKGPSQTLTKILLGQSIGIDPASSVMGIFFNSQGKLTLSANLMAMRIKASGKYRYKFLERSAKACEVEVFEKVDGKWESQGTERVEYDDFKHLHGNPVWKNYPKNMLFARCISNVAKFYTPDVFGGSPVYLPDEIPGSGIEVNPETLEVESAFSPDEKIIDVEFESSSYKELKELMDKSGLTTQEIANKLRVPESVISNPNSEQASQLVDLLKARKNGT